MVYVLQFITTYWWLFILSVASAILELYVVPNVIAWYKNLNYPNHRRFSIVALCILVTAIIKFIINIPESDPTQAQEYLVETSMDCGCESICTCGFVSSTSDSETVTQSYVDALILSSAKRELTNDELQSLSQEELALLRNAIFAMAGMQYDYGSHYFDIFQSYDWYHPYVSKEDFTWDYFNSFQFKNMNKIINYEKSMGYRK